MMEKETPRLWIKQRENELELLEEEIEDKKESIRNQRTDLSNYIEEIQFIEELQSKEHGLYEGKSGEKLLIKMKEELESKKNPLEKTIKEYEEKIAKSKNLEIYIVAAHKKW